MLVVRLLRHHRRQPVTLVSCCSVSVQEASGEKR